jgi:hypothetical protein
MLKVVIFLLLTQTLLCAQTAKVVEVDPIMARDLKALYDAKLVADEAYAKGPR